MSLQKNQWNTEDSKREKSDKKKSCQKTINDSIKSFLIRNYFRCELIKISNKRHRIAKWILKKRQDLHYLQEIYFRIKDTHRIKAKGWNKILHTNANQKRAKVVTLILVKNCQKRQRRTLNNEKWSIHQQNITIINTYALYITAPKYMRQTLTKLKG